MNGTLSQSPIFDTAEGGRLDAAEREGWRRWGPYLSERQWGTVREDYSADGDAWSYFPHDHARSRAYRWGEDGIAGFCDDRQRWCLSLALWNGADAILKERMFGLSNPEGNHGEDVKELWWYLDGTPTHSYGRMLYKYPQGAFPYEDLVAENGRRQGLDQPEYELIDTGVFDGDRYFDVTVEYAKRTPTDILMRVTVVNRAPVAAALHVLPQLVARNTWSWKAGTARPSLAPRSDAEVDALHPSMPAMRFAALQPAEFLFCENETNRRRFGGEADDGAFKDAINDRLTKRDMRPLPEQGTKCAAVSRHEIGGGETLVLRYRLAEGEPAPLDGPGFDAVCGHRRDEADAFFAVLQKDIADPDARLVQRQALAGLLWSKQVYRYSVRRWLDGDPAEPPPPPERHRGRNADWTHLDNADVVLMPDKWEYPWYASWDLAFHAIAAATVDPALAKEQLLLLTREWYMHPSGQLPAYEWALSDANPPIQAFAALRVYRMDSTLTGVPDRAFLERMFHKLMLNFTWWVNRKDASNRNLFQGGFLGLDNIGVFDRSQPVPGGGTIDQADGTAWMAMYALNLMRMALELAVEDSVYEDIATKFFEHFLYIASAMTHVGGTEAEKHESGGGRGLWDERDGFFYDVLELPDGGTTTLRVRSLVGLIPLCAVEVLGADLWTRFPDFAERTGWMLRHRPDLTSQVSRFGEPGKNEQLLLSLLRRHRMKAIRWQLELARIGLDAAELHADRRPSRVRALLRRELPNRICQEFREAGQPSASRGRTRAPSPRAVPEGRERIPTGDRRSGSAGRARSAGPHPLQRVLPRRNGLWRRRLAPDRLDGSGGPPDPAASRDARQGFGGGNETSDRPPGMTPTRSGQPGRAIARRSRSSRSLRSGRAPRRAAPDIANSGVPVKMAWRSEPTRRSRCS